MEKRHALLATLAAALAGGCAMEETKPAPPSPPPASTHYAGPADDPWRLSTADIQSTRAGAAIRQGGHLHVLTRHPSGNPQVTAPAATDAPAIAQVLHSDVDGTATTRGPAPGQHGARERAAWEKFCNGALGLSDEEWELIRGKDVPEDLVPRCTWPK